MEYLMSDVICIGSIAKALGMPRNKGADEPNVNEARENIKKRKEMAKSKAVEEAKRASENTTKGKLPPHLLMLNYQHHNLRLKAHFPMNVFFVIPPLCVTSPLLPN